MEIDEQWRLCCWCFKRLSPPYAYASTTPGPDLELTGVYGTVYSFYLTLRDYNIPMFEFDGRCVWLIGSEYCSKPTSDGYPAIGAAKLAGCQIAFSEKFPRFFRCGKGPKL